LDYKLQRESIQEKYALFGYYNFDKIYSGYNTAHYFRSIVGALYYTSTLLRNLTETIERTKLRLLKIRCQAKQL